ncbi:DUF4110 domain-containing protein [Citrus sinensis]|uniref:DUF4110 domain-containing protein n=1 Tax=Citrus sinensis TaxID=2711 RepID=A0ACB8LTL7_CITSI|nr:DUF4110 domain-containing protein [Citrus sinensis]
MGKKNKKAGKGKEKTERKTAKAEEKRARRETKKISPEDDIDAILLSIQKEEAKKKEVHVEDNVPAPSPRSNCSLNINPLKETELILYGGEFYNGNKTYVYGDLYRYDVEKQEWKVISSPNSPPPRSAHQAVSWKNYLYIFGGEFTSPNQERFHHYKDFWMLDLKTNQWEQLNLKGCPSPRSGHRMVLYKHKIIVFGGFYDTLREAVSLAIGDTLVYYNDLYVFDLDQFKWQEIKPRFGSMWPSPRSGFQFFVYQDEVFLYGGYSKEVSTDKNQSEKGSIHSDLWSLDPRTWEWSKVKKIGMPPGPRAGFSMCVHKKRALLFGGVVDMEMKGDVIMSLFLNELYGFQLDNHRWYPLELRKEKSTKDKLKKSSEQKTNSSALQEKLNPIEAEEFDANEKDENAEYYEEADEMESNIDNLSECVPNSVIVDDGVLAAKSGGKPYESKKKSDMQKSLLPEASESEWVEASEGEDEDDDEDDSEDEGNGGSSSDETGDDDDDDEEDAEARDGDAGSLQMGDAVAIIKGEGKNVRRKEKRARIEQIRANLGLSDSQRTPMELRKDGFDLAEARYRELKPILDELAVLEAEQKAEEAEGPETTSRKRGKKKNKNLAIK